MKSRDEKFMKRWGKTRKMGLLKFSLIFGGVWGIVTVILVELFALQEKSFSQIFYSRDFLVHLVIYLVVGILVFGLILWRMNETKYKKIEVKSNNSQ